jgi:hypothetical protein
MNFKLIAAASALCYFGSISLAQQPGQPLTAPGYYIAIEAQHSHDKVIQVRGASNLPPGAKVMLQVVAMNDQAWKTFSEDVCVAVDDKGLFEQEIGLSAGSPWRRDFLVIATFLPNECRQNAHVLQLLGSHGQYLGHDNRRVTMNEVEMGITSGMTANPQLFQVSGWYFGISALARVEG